MISRTATALTLALALAAPLAGQSGTTYRRTQGDTLRYRQVVDGRMDSKGAPSTETSVEATVAFTFGTGDTATAWFEAYRSNMKSGGRDMTPPSEPVPNRPSVLLFGANGALQVVSGVSAPPRAAGSGGPFASFFLKLPDRPLAAGLEWADTVASRQESPDGSRAESQYIGRYRVVGDTAAGAGKALVITSRGEGTRKMTRTVAAGTSETRTRTVENGRILFSPKLGRMLARESTMENTTRTTTRGGEGLDPMRGRGGGPTTRIETGGVGARAMEMRGRTHTLIELMAPEQLKAAPR